MRRTHGRINSLLRIVLASLIGGLLFSVFMIQINNGSIYRFLGNIGFGASLIFIASLLNYAFRKDLRNPFFCCILWVAWNLTLYFTSPVEFISVHNYWQGMVIGLALVSILQAVFFTVSGFFIADVLYDE